jgi:hypothetical protein
LVKTVKNTVTKGLPMATYYSVKQAATILGFSTNSIYKFLDEGRLKGHRGNSDLGRFKIPHTSLEKFVGSEIPEEAVINALKALPDESMQIKKEFTVPDSPSVISHQSTVISQPLPLKVTRTLIIIGLLFLLLDLDLSGDFSFTDQILRLTIMAILIVLTYQYGGLSGGNQHVRSNP